LWISFLGHHARQADAWLFGAEYQQYHRILRRLVINSGCDSLLDVGCGENSPVGRFAAEIRYRVGVDAHLPSIERSRRAGIHSEYVVANVMDIGAKFSALSFDCVTLLEVIEHLSRADGEQLLAQCEGIARKKVVVSTPNGFVSQAPTPDNPFQEHISGWTAADFQSRGYEVTGIAGWKWLRGPLMQPRWRPRAIFGRLSLVTEAWFEKHPDEAFQLLCVKTKNT
jgi:SAM-dependent methyltransferase